MSYCLRLVCDEEDIEQIDSISPRFAKLILGTVELTGLDFNKCLELCNAQVIYTPEADYWYFAKKNMSHFNFLFQPVNARAGHEKGIVLSNIFIMLVYLRLMSAVNDHYVPDLFQAALHKRRAEGNPEQLVALVDKFTSLIEAPVRPGRAIVKTAEVNTGGQFDFHNRIRSILGF